MKYLKAFISALILLGLSHAHSSAQETVRVRAGVQSSLGRVVFDWPGPIGYEAKIEGRLATISFERPGNFDFAPFRTTLSGYVSDVATGDGGRTIRLTLTGDYQLRKMLNGSSVVIDFVGTPGRTALPPPPPPQPVQAAAPPPPPPPKPSPAPTSLRPAAASGPVKLQAGQQEAFTRLSFIWPGPPPAYNVTKSGSVINLTFDRGSKVEMGNIEGEPPRFVKAVRLLSTQDHLAFNIEMEPGSGFRHFSEERDVIVDIMAPGMTNPAPTESASKQIADDQHALAERQGEITGPKSQVFDPDSGPLPDRLTTPELKRAQRADAEKRAQAELDRINATSKKPNAAAAAPAAAAPAQPAAPAEPPPEPPKPTSAPRGAGPIISMPVPPTPAGSVGTVIVTYAGDAAHTRLGFPFPVHTPAAIFTRAGAVWAIFDAQATLDFKALSSSSLKPRQFSTQRGTVFLMPLPEGQGVQAGADGNDWTIDFAASPERGEPAEVIPRPNKPGGADVLVQLRERGDFHHLDDPIVGDHLDIATTLRPGQGVASTYAFQAFELLPTAQGVVVEPQMDGTTIEADPEGVAVTQEGGLALSNGVRPSEQAMRGAGGTPGAEGFVEFERWGRQNEGPFWRVREKLERAAALAPRLVKNAARLELARFFLANHFNSEAVGELNLMLSGEPDLDRDVAFHALRGIARVGMYRPKEGIEDLSIPQLQVDANAALWRGLADTYLQDWSAAAAEFRRGLKLIDRYPSREHLMFALASARANIELGDKEAAATDVTDINKLKPGPPQAFRAQYLLARLKELRNDVGGALSDYDKVIAGNDRESRANARYRKILIQEHAGTMNAADAIDQLETLRYTWRGDDLERDILRSLGQIYVKSGDYRTAFETMRSAIAKYPNTKQADAIKEDMDHVFADLFLHGGANALPPVKALGLYYDYRDLTPVGKDGDEMIRRLVDRLVSVDLLTQAEELLQHQVEKRLAGTAQAQVAARLAVIYLLDKKPGDAAKILDQTRQIQLPNALTHQRALLYARAEMDLGRTSDALSALQGDDSLDAQRLRADIYWAATDWGNAAKSMDVLLAPAAANSNPLDPAQINLVLKSSIALALAGDKNGLERIKRTFGPRMEKTADNESFLALTTSPDLNNVGFRDLASRIANTKTFESFLNGYEQQIRSGGLGAIN